MKAPYADRCPLCGGEKKEGTATLTVDLKATVVVVRDVPATIYSLCGNEWIKDEVAADLEAIVDAAEGRR